jgi:Ras-related protein Rab-1A
MILMTTDYDHLFKVLIIGDSGTGKSSLMLRLVDDTFINSYISTIGVDFKIHTILHNNKIIKLQLWDTAGQERFRTITSSYYRGANGVFIIFDLTNLETLSSIQTWIDNVNKYCTQPNVPVVIVGTKLDLFAKTMEAPMLKIKLAEIADNIKKIYKYECVFTSSKDDLNVTQTANMMVNKLVDNLSISIDTPSLKKITVGSTNAFPVKSSGLCC